jgi:hypothetical protein
LTLAGLHCKEKSFLQHRGAHTKFDRKLWVFTIMLKGDKFIATFEFYGSLFTRLTKYDERHKQKFDHWFAE